MVLSIELPEAQILAEQMNKELRGKQVLTCDLRNCERLQRVGFVNKDLSDFAQITGGTIEFVVSRGNVMRIKLNSGMNLLLAPEYGGSILFHARNSIVPWEISPQTPLHRRHGANGRVKWHGRHPSAQGR
jgi:hypothetical protein